MSPNQKAFHRIYRKIHYDTLLHDYSSIKQELGDLKSRIMKKPVKNNQYYEKRNLIRLCDTLEWSLAHAYHDVIERTYLDSP